MLCATLLLLGPALNGSVRELAPVSAWVGSPSIPEPDAGSQTAVGLPVRPFQLLDNPGFDLPASHDRVPYWSGTGGSLQAGGGLRLGAGARYRQPIAAWAPGIDGLRLEGAVDGSVLLAVVDGDEPRVEPAVSGAFTWEVGREAREAGASFVPRLELLVEAQEPCLLEGLRAQVPLPAPSEEQLRDLVSEELAVILSWWRELGADGSGPRRTRFAAGLWDVLTGEPVLPLPGWYSAYTDLLLRAAVHDPAQRDQAEGLLDDVLELATHPETGLPRKVSCVTDEPLDSVAVEVWLQLQFLVELCEGRYHARPDQRARARWSGRA